MKKKVITKTLAGILSAILLIGGVVLASDGSKNIDIFFRNIKIMIDGAEYVPTDADGNVVEPFIHNGTTYLPVRAVANAFGKDVKWDGENATVYLGKEGRMMPDNRLDKVQYVDYYEADKPSELYIINGTIQDYLSNTYTNGILFLMYYGHSNINNTKGCKSSIAYPLNGQYSELSGKVVLPKKIDIIGYQKDNPNVEETDIVFYGDGEEIYRINSVIKTMPGDFNIDVTGINTLKIELDVQYDITSYHAVALTDLGLYK